MDESNKAKISKENQTLIKSLELMLTDYSTKLVAVGGTDHAEFSHGGVVNIESNQPNCGVLRINRTVDSSVESICAVIIDHILGAHGEIGWYLKPDVIVATTTLNELRIDEPNNSILFHPAITNSIPFVEKTETLADKLKRLRPDDMPVLDQRCEEVGMMYWLCARNVP